MFADTLGHHAVAMVRVGDRGEPKAAVAMMAACFGGGIQDLAPSVSAQTSEILAYEIRNYVKCHDKLTINGALVQLDLHAYNAGDAMTVARAMGQGARPLVAEEARNAEASTDEAQAEQICFSLDLFPSDEQPSVAGRFLSDLGRRRRAGGGFLDPQDRWMTDTVPLPGDILLPRLRWSRQEGSGSLRRPAHIAIAFDIFPARLTWVPVSQLPGGSRPLHVFGLSALFERDASFGGDPVWRTYLPLGAEGEKVPDNRLASERVLKLQAACARAAAQHAGGGPDTWPVLETSLPADTRALLDRLHDTSDWVVTADRNACIEYFDSPNTAPAIYDKYVIDAVPERGDLNALKLVTSTSNLEEVRNLVDNALGEMGLSSSEKNCRFLLHHLKALSGRLAIRLADGDRSASELDCTRISTGPLRGLGA